MISGKANFDYDRYKDNFIIDNSLSIEEVAKKNLKSQNLDHILLISENLNQNFNHIHIQPLSSLKFDLFDNAMEIHLLLLNNEELSNTQKLDYTKLQRYFMKKYLSEIIKTNKLK